MKVKQVSALRSKRGLHRVNGAEPQVVGLTPQTPDIRKTETMKTYIYCANRNLSSRKNQAVHPARNPFPRWPQPAIADEWRQ